MPSRDRITKPVINVMSSEDAERWGCAMSLISHEHDDLVQAHKDVFGSQTYCWTGLGARHWVWELGGCRVYVSNAKGVSFEVETDQDRDEAMQHFEEYLAQWECLELGEEDETLEDKANRLAETSDND